MTSIIIIMTNCIINAIKFRIELFPKDNRFLLNTTVIARIIYVGVTSENGVVQLINPCQYNISNWS